VMDSPHNDPELHNWLHWASERGNTPTFVRTVAEAARMACMPDYALLRPVLVELKWRYPEGCHTFSSIAGPIPDSCNRST
jgi:hypothetical protein